MLATVAGVGGSRWSARMAMAGGRRLGKNGLRHGRKEEEKVEKAGRGSAGGLDYVPGSDDAGREDGDVWTARASVEASARDSIVAAAIS